MNFYRKMALAGALVASSISATAFADSITLDSSDIGSSFTVNYDGSADGNPIAGLTSSATFTLTGITATSYIFDYSLDNTSSGGVTSTVSSFGFNIDPDATSASSTGAFDVALLSGNYPAPINTVDVCFKAQFSGACSNGGGVDTGLNGSGTMSFNFASAPPSLNLEEFFVRYQAIDGAGGVTSATGTGTIGTTSTSSGGPGPVPEPGMLGLLAAALIGAGMMRSRQRKVTQPALA